MNSTPKRALQVTPTQPARPASARKQATRNTRRSDQPEKPVYAPRRQGGRPSSQPQARHPRKRPSCAPRRQGRPGPRPQASHPRRLSPERIAQLAVSGLTALAQLLNAIHRIRTGPGPS